MPEAAERGHGVEWATAVWRRRKWWAILAFAIPCAAAVSLVAFLPNLYRSTATVLVERQKVPEELVHPTVTAELETRLQTLTQEILSRSRLGGLITRFGLYPALRQRHSADVAVERMRKDIQLELKGVERDGERRATVAFALSYRGRDSETVALVTNTLAGFYIEENLKAREHQATGTAEFLKVHLEGVNKRLDEQERRLGDFKRRHLGELPQQLQANLATLERLHTQLRLNRDNQVRVARHAAFAQQLSPVDSSAPVLAQAPNPRAARIAQLKQELTELRTRFSDKYPDVVRAKAELALLERELAEAKAPDGKPAAEPRAPGSPPVQGLLQTPREAELEILKTEEQRLEAAIATYQQRVANTPRWEQELQELSRDYETTKELYQSLVKRHEDARLAESLEQRQKGEQFRVLDPAVPSRIPAAPHRARLLLVGLLVSLGLAAAAVVLAEQLDTSFHTVDELRTFTTVPVLVSIPRIVTEGDAVRRRRRFWLAAIATMLGLVLLVGAAAFVARGNEQLVWLLTKSGA